MECTSHECGNPSDLYLCVQCVRDLQAWIDKVPEIRAMLFTTMAKLDNVAPKRGEGANGMSKEPAGPVRDHAMDKRYALAMWQGLDAEQLAHDQHAGGFQGMLEAMIEDAHKIVDIPHETVVYGPCQADTPTGKCEADLKGDPESDTVTCGQCGTAHKVDEVIQSRTERMKGEPLPPKEVCEYVHRTAKAFVTRKDIKNWVQHGHLKYVLDRVTTTTRPTRAYYPGDVLKTYLRMNDRKRYGV